MKLLNIPDLVKEALLCTAWVDHFLWYITAHFWTSLAADSGSSVAASDAANGVLVITTGATDNNEAAAKTSQEIYKFAANKPFQVFGRMQYTEANVDDANVAFMVADAIGANAMLDDGAGPKASFSGAMIYKVDGGTVWKCRSSIGASNTDTASGTTAGGAGYVVPMIEYDGNGHVTYWMDTAGGNAPIQLKDANGLPIVHTVDPTSATEMQVGFYVKAGGANSEVLSVDLAAGSAKTN